MDFANLDTSDLANAGAVLHVRAPDGAPLHQENGEPVTITLLGADSDALIKIDRQTTNEHLRGMTNGQVTVTAEIAEAKLLTRLAKATVAWSGVVVDGKAVECNEANARALYARFRFLRAQADAFIADRAHFMKASPGT